jgi:hypothetical protein
MYKQTIFIQDKKGKTKIKEKATSSTENFTSAVLLLLLLFC